MTHKLPKFHCHTITLVAAPPSLSLQLDTLATPLGLSSVLTLVDSHSLPPLSTVLAPHQTLNSFTLIHLVADHLLPVMTGQPACRLLGSCSRWTSQSHAISDKCAAEERQDISRQSSQP